MYAGISARFHGWKLVLRMRPDPLIQKLFAIERAIGSSDPETLRAMVIDAEESAIEAELQFIHTLHRLDHPQRAA